MKFKLLKEEKLFNKKIEIPKMGSWPKSFHMFDKDSIWAINAAIAAHRPLLIRGEPGVGKSQLARATAAVLKCAFISVVVHAHSECQDLLYHFDTVARLGKAQSLFTCSSKEEAENELKPKKFLSPGPVWWAFNWDDAEKIAKDCPHRVYTPQIPEGCKKENGSVLLIDEIDKADADLPNGLLETLGNGAFTVPYIDTPVELKEDRPMPLVIITTNEERDLPNAFLRRCMVLQMKLKEDKDELIQWLVERGEVHFGDKCTKRVRKEAAEQLWEDRVAAKKHKLPAPGQAEYIDILRALSNMGEDEAEQRKNLIKIKDFALKKYPEESL